MPVQIAAVPGRHGVMRTAVRGSTVLGRGFELRGNTGRGAGRIQQQGKDEQECHVPFYSGSRVRMEL